MVSRWPVLVTLAVEAADVDHAGMLTEAGVERLFASVRTTYFDRCSTVDESELELRATQVRIGDAPATASVTVSVSVVEVFPERFTMNALVRPASEPGTAAAAMCSLALAGGGETSTAIRDEFIALAHDARHFH